MNSSLTPPNARRACLIVLALGMLVRVAVFFVLAPNNNDNHFEVIRHIHRFHALPATGEFNQSYHPPLYHALAALTLTLGGIKTVQALSLVLSLGTLALIYSLLRRLPWLDERLKPWCLALPALHPEFVIYTLFISNDTLAIFIGALIFAQAARCLERPTLRRQALLALWLGLGLLTKFTFLAFCAPVMMLILLLNARQGLPQRAQALRLAALLALAGAVGGYKFVENAIHFQGQPFINTLDFDLEWIEAQRPTWLGPSSLLDVNLWKLVRNPIISSATAHSWPLIFYGSFWYSFIPECGFQGNLTRWRFLGSAIYVLALAPTLLMAAGAASWVKRLATIKSRAAARTPEECLYLGFALLVLAMSLLLVEYAGWKYDVWSVFQGRLLFPAYCALLLLFHEGLRWASRRRLPGRFARAAMAGLFIIFLAYYAIEIRLSIIHPVSPMKTYFMPYVVDMKAR